MRKTLTKKQIEERDKIIFEREIDWDQEGSGGIMRFRELDIVQLEQLNEKGLLDLEDYQNDSPSVKEFMAFMKKYPAVTAIGYVVSPKRDDVRVSLEGIECEQAEVTPELKDDFIEMCRYADELEIKKGLYAWWD